MPSIKEQKSKSQEAKPSHGHSQTQPTDVLGFQKWIPPSSLSAPPSPKEMSQMNRSPPSRISQYTGIHSCSVSGKRQMLPFLTVVH